MASIDYDIQQMHRYTQSVYCLIFHINAHIFIQDIFIPFLHWFPITSTNIHNQHNGLGIGHVQGFIQFQYGAPLDLPSDWEDEDETDEE